MKTYLIVWINSDGAAPSEITQKLNKVGFKEIQGQYDYVYSWSRGANVDSILRLGDTIQKTLNGCKVMFKLETI